MRRDPDLDARTDRVVDGEKDDREQEDLECSVDPVARKTLGPDHQSTLHQDQRKGGESDRDRPGEDLVQVQQPGEADDLEQQVRGQDREDRAEGGNRALDLVGHAHGTACAGFTDEVEGPCNLFRSEGGRGEAEKDEGVQQTRPGNRVVGVAARIEKQPDAQSEASKRPQAGCDLGRAGPGHIAPDHHVHGEQGDAEDTRCGNEDPGGSRGTEDAFKEAEQRKREDHPAQHVDDLPRGCRIRPIEEVGQEADEPECREPCDLEERSAHRVEPVLQPCAQAHGSAENGSSEVDECSHGA